VIVSVVVDVIVAVEVSVVVQVWDFSEHDQSLTYSQIHTVVSVVVT
jgi:hypothetical protein